MKTIVKNRFSILSGFITLYCFFGFLIRLTFFILSFQVVEASLLNILKIFFLGCVFDFGTAVFLIFIYGFYLFVTPTKRIGSLPDKWISAIILFFTFFITVFSFLAEFPFWSEFNTRFNFIAVDYLIYTYEVFENINQSYPLPILIIVLLLLTAGFFVYFSKTKVFPVVFSDRMPFRKRLAYMLILVFVGGFYLLFIKNTQAETSKNLYVNELSKNGVYSFFAAFRSNELDYETFYPLLSNQEAFARVKKEIKQNNQVFLSDDRISLDRRVTHTGTEHKPNIILICVESLSGEFLHAFGNEQKLTPNLDKLAQQSIFFTNLYATGTRTVRGMEALTLGVPPAPGNSIVRRPDNANLYSIATILRQKDYQLNFIYGGDGYFDNMNTFFGGQGFNIIDRNRGNPLADDIKTQRINIEDSEVTFENAWGICDQDIYNKTLKMADAQSQSGKPFFDFIMTTSNHKPYSFPEGVIDMPQGSREAAVKYTDYAIGKFIDQARTKAWFQNTVFIIVADHCASSAGKWEINLKNHHIPAMLYNLSGSQKVTKLVSQIDLLPTVFGYLNWSYTTSLYGKDIRLMNKQEERAYVGNYRTLGLLTNRFFCEINDKKKCNQYLRISTGTTIKPLETENETLKKLTIAHYQTASYRFKYGKMQEK